MIIIPIVCLTAFPSTLYPQTHPIPPQKTKRAKLPAEKASNTRHLHDREHMSRPTDIIETDKLVATSTAGATPGLLPSSTHTDGVS